MYPRAHKLQLLNLCAKLLRLAHLEPVLHNKRSHCIEQPTRYNKEWLLLISTRESLHKAMKTQHTPKQTNNGHKFKRGISLKKDIQISKHMKK